MTAYGKPHQQSHQRQDWMQKREARRKVLAAVRARRREIYKQFLAKKTSK